VLELVEISDIEELLKEERISLSADPEIEAKGVEDHIHSMSLER